MTEPLPSGSVNFVRRATLQVPPAQAASHPLNAPTVKWLRFDGRRWVPVHPTLADRLGISRAARVFKRTLRRLRKRQKLFGIDSQQEFATFAAELKAEQRKIAFHEGAHQHIGNVRHALHTGQEIGPNRSECRAQPDSIARLHDHHSVATASRDAKNDAAVGSGGDATVFSGNDSHANPPSGSCISPKVAEAGESETPLPGGGHGDD